ncbi:MAG: hypothetical protein ACLTTQ_07915, partial [Christensenellales bacterium]
AFIASRSDMISSITRHISDLRRSMIISNGFRMTAGAVFFAVRLKHLNVAQIDRLFFKQKLL